MKPTLFLLAAGMGSRYGGLKQLDGLGPKYLRCHSGRIRQNCMGYPQGFRGAVPYADSL